MLKNAVLFIYLLLMVSAVFGQGADSVDVTFYYYPDNTPNTVYLPGEFNGWTLNNASKMTRNPADGSWSRSYRLRVGGPNPLPNPGQSIPGAYQYKFNADGNWLPDPLVPRNNPNDNNNSYLFIKDPTIHYLLPNNTLAFGKVRTRFPEITAYIFPTVAGAIDTASFSVKVDNVTYFPSGSSYDPANNRFSYLVPDALSDGTHSLKLTVASVAGNSNADSTTFSVEANIAQMFTLPAETWKTEWPIRGAFFTPDGGLDSTVSSAEILCGDSTWTVTVTNGQVDIQLPLHEGENDFVLRGQTSTGLQQSNPVAITRKVNHHPYAQVSVIQNGALIEFDGSASSDPDGQNLAFEWREDPGNPAGLAIAGAGNAQVSASLPGMSGEYFVSLLVVDSDGNRDSTRVFFDYDVGTQTVRPAGIKSNPQWVHNGRIYLMFIKGFTPEGTISAATANLDYVHDMGFNIIWVLPVMEIPGNVDNQINIGYYISDFMNVEQSYGTNQDFKTFVQSAHDRGMKVILDVTPNHTANVHEFAQQAIQNGDFSPYWNYYQTQHIPHDTQGLGECVSAAGIYYYCAFSDVLLNYNWSDIDARQYMIDVYKYWLTEFDVDGFRFDVYWGPHNRYGESVYGTEIRRQLKHIKPDILLLGETAGTGSGTELSYADHGAGLDAAYDWALKDKVRNFSFTSSAVTDLHNTLNNNGYYPGENSYFLRFLENQDEDRIAYLHNSFVKTMPLATAIFTAPGLPQMHYGQEVGFGRGMGQPGEPDLNDRRRGIINWTFDGQALLQPHYQKLASIRGQFPAFSQHKMDTNNDGSVTSADESDFIKLATGAGIVYGILRPYQDANGMAVMNFSNSAKSATINLASAGLKFSTPFNTGTTYWVNDLYNDTSYQALGSELVNFTIPLEGYESAVYTIATVEQHAEIPPLPSVTGFRSERPKVVNNFRLYQNYPNPFNPQTRISFDLPAAAPVNVEIYNILGSKVITLMNRRVDAGHRDIIWNAVNDHGSPVASGVYILKITAGKETATKRMVLLR